MKKLFFFIGLSIALGSCYNDNYDKLYVDHTVVAPDLCDTATNPATYAASVKGILTSKCATSGCHNTSTHQSGYDFSLYATDSSGSARIKVRAFSTSSPMPPVTSSALSDCEKAELMYWLNHGSHNN